MTNMTNHLLEIESPTRNRDAQAHRCLFLRHQDLPAEAQASAAARNIHLLQLVGAAGSNTDTIVIVGRSARPGHDVDCWIARVARDRRCLDWGAVCDSLAASTAVFSIDGGLIHRERIARRGTVEVRVWNVNLRKSIVVQVPVKDGRAGHGDAARLAHDTMVRSDVRVEFIDPATVHDAFGSTVFPTAKLVDTLDVPGIAGLRATLINAGVTAIIVNAAELGLAGSDLEEHVNRKPDAPALFDLLREHGAARFGFATDMSSPSGRHPVIAIVTPGSDHATLDSGDTAKRDLDLFVHCLAGGVVHGALPDLIAVAIATAAAIPGTVASDALREPGRTTVRLGHSSGTVQLDANVRWIEHEWLVIKVGAVAYPSPSEI